MGIPLRSLLRLPAWAFGLLLLSTPALFADSFRCVMGGGPCTYRIYNPATGQWGEPQTIQQGQTLIGGSQTFELLTGTWDRV